MQALEQWYETMIPALFPMMLMSSILVDTGFANKIGQLLNNTFFRFLKISNSGCYCLITGFLFGFPLGAKTTTDLYKLGHLSQNEAHYLLGFVNCIGPMYAINFIHALFPQYNLFTLVFGIYGLACFYGILLRYTIYRKKPFESPYFYDTQTIPYLSITDALYESVPKCGRSILMLGGYMVLFQILFVPLKHLLKSLNFVTNTLYPLLEITGGLLQLPAETSLPLILFYTHFGGACCFVQTYSFLKPAGLSFQNYALHKLLLSAVAFLMSILL